MTFSDSKIVELLKNDFVPVWESVSPVRQVTFDLGDGRSVKGSVGGEIAIYFCTPDGLVFDILPALQSPAATHTAIKDALAFFQKHKGKPSEEAVQLRHTERMHTILKELWKDDPGKFLAADGSISDFSPDPFEVSKEGEKKRDQYISSALDKATRDIRVMAVSKTITSIQGSHITVVEPGGRGYYQWQTARAFLGFLPDSTNRNTQPLFGVSALHQRITEKSALEKIKHWKAELKTPPEWKHLLFEGILHQPLVGGVVEYNSESLKAISIQAE